MQDTAANVLAFLARVILSKAFFWTCGVLLLVVGIPLAPRKRIPWLWRIAMVTLAANCFSWPLIVGYLSRFDLEIGWILVFGAAALSFSWSISMALAAGKEPEGLLGMVAATLDQQLATRGGSSALEIPANATIDQQPLLEKALVFQEDPLSGNWRGSADGLEVTLSLVQRGTSVRGACVLRTEAGKQTWRCMGALEPNGEIVMQLTSGNDQIEMSVVLESATAMRAQFEGAGQVAHRLVLHKEMSV